MGLCSEESSTELVYGFCPPCCSFYCWFDTITVDFILKYWACRGYRGPVPTEFIHPNQIFFKETTTSIYQERRRPRGELVALGEVLPRQEGETLGQWISRLEMVRDMTLDWAEQYEMSKLASRLGSRSASPENLDYFYSKQSPQVHLPTLWKLCGAIPREFPQDEDKIEEVAARSSYYGSVHEAMPVQILTVAKCRSTDEHYLARFTTIFRNALSKSQVRISSLAPGSPPGQLTQGSDIEPTTNQRPRAPALKKATDSLIIHRNRKLFKRALKFLDRFPDDEEAQEEYITLWLEDTHLRSKDTSQVTLHAALISSKIDSSNDEGNDMDESSFLDFDLDGWIEKCFGAL